MNTIENSAKIFVDRVTAHALRHSQELWLDYAIEDQMLEEMSRHSEGAERIVKDILDNREEFDALFEKHLSKRIWYLVEEGFGRIEGESFPSFIPFSQTETNLDLDL